MQTLMHNNGVFLSFFLMAHFSSRIQWCSNYM